jgi:hypothetical protein
MTAMQFQGRVEARVFVPSGVSVDATNASGGPSTCPIAAGAYFMSELVAALQSSLNAGRPSGWTVALSASGTSATGLVSITCSGSWSIDCTDAGDLAEILGFASDTISGSGTVAATSQCDGLWFPNSPLILDGDAREMPILSQRRDTVGPSGSTIAFTGPVMYQHENLRWSSVPLDRYREQAAATPRASWERWVKVTQLKQGGYTWFAPGSPFQIYDHTGQLVGSDGNDGAGPVYGWTAPDLSRVRGKRVSEEGWTGLWQIDIPRLVSRG